LALGDRGEEASEGGAEIAGGQKAAGKVIGDVLAGGLASEGFGRRRCDGEKQVPRCSRDDTGALGASPDPESPTPETEPEPEPAPAPTPAAA